ncbi:MAG: VPLPA-CTERM sorting domain-containing protein [Pseudomonadota bacterium]
MKRLVMMTAVAFFASTAAHAISLVDPSIASDNISATDDTGAALVAPLSDGDVLELSIQSQGDRVGSFAPAGSFTLDTFVLPDNFQLTLTNGGGANNGLSWTAADLDNGGVFTFTIVDTDSLTIDANGFTMVGTILADNPVDTDDDIGDWELSGEFVGSAVTGVDLSVAFPAGTLVTDVPVPASILLLAGGLAGLGLMRRRANA